MYATTGANGKCCDTARYSYSCIFPTQHVQQTDGNNNNNLEIEQNNNISFSNDVGRINCNNARLREFDLNSKWIISLTGLFTTGELKKLDLML